MAPCRKAFLFLSLLSTTGTGSRNMGTQARPTSTLPTSRLPPKTGKQANKEDPQNSSARDANKKADWWLSQAKKCKEECICTIFNIWIAQVLEAPSFVFGSTSFWKHKFWKHHHPPCLGHLSQTQNSSPALGIFLHFLSACLQTSPDISSSRRVVTDQLIKCTLLPFLQDKTKTKHLGRSYRDIKKKKYFLLTPALLISSPETSVVDHTINIAFRDHKITQSHSPGLSNLTVLGV